MINKFHSSKMFCNGQTHQKESLREIHRDAICKNMQSMASFIVGERQQGQRMRACKTGKEGNIKEKLTEKKTTKQVTFVFKS